MDMSPNCAPCGNQACSPPQPRGQYLIQKIIGSGKLHRRSQVYCLYPACIPAQARPPFTVVDVITAGDPAWEEAPCPERCALLIRVFIPLLVRIRDCNGCLYTVSARIEDEFRLRVSCPEHECWRGQIFVQAAVRLCGSACRCSCAEEGIRTPLEVMVEGFLLVPCPVGTGQPPCPPPKPWYPEPCQDRFCR